MPDVVRSDSQRSDTSLRPRVSFNRDVHVKRIVPRVGPTALEANESHYSNVPSARKNHTKRPKKEYIEKRKVNYNPKPEENSEKFYTLPRTRKEYKEINDAIIVNSKPPKKPQRIFATEYKPDTDKFKTATLNSSKNSSNNKTKLNRSASDAAYSKTKFSENKDQQHKKQLTPIAEVPPQSDFFSNISDNFKENNDNRGLNSHKNKVSKKENRTLREKNNRKENNKKNKIIVIDIDKAEDISGQSKKLRLKDSFFAKKFFTNKRNRNNGDSGAPIVRPNLKISPQSENSEEKSDNSELSSQIPSVSQLKKTYENSEMIHSSQKPADRPPLTKGRTVDLMVRRLNKDTSSPPPKPNIMVTPNLINQHNNNQPFSYTRGLSPERYTPDESFTTNPSGVPIIYAQVVCNNDRNGTAKQTIHTAFSKRYSLSDSDEGLGYEEVPNVKHRPSYTRFGDELKTKSYRVQSGTNNCDIHLDFCDCNNLFNETSQRGCGDGMEEAKQQTENITNSIRTRRDLLESRIAKKIHDARGTEVKFDSLSSSPSTLMRDQNKKYNEDLERRVLYYGTDESKSYDSQINESESRKLFSKTLYKSTPEIYRKSNEQLSNNYTYHNSLQRDRYKQTNRTRPVKDNLSPKKNYIYSDYNHVESEDEGFASSLLIASEKQHAEDGIKRGAKKEYDSDLNFSAEDEVHHYLDEIDKKISKSYNEQFVPRERSIDDGSHFDPRIDKEVTLKQSTLKRNANKPPKPEKKSSLEKVKKLFNRDTKKKSKGKNEMVREESLLARYTEYKGSSDNLDNKDTSYSENKDYYYGTRKRAKTPSVNSSQSQDTAETRKSNNSYSSWFKSLDRISQKHKKNKDKAVKANGSPKNLRFFGDTESEAGELSRNAKTPKNRISQSSRELHNISEEISNPELISKRDSGYKSMLNISDRSRDYKSPPGRNQKPPMFPFSKSSHDISRSAEDRRRKYEQSSLESSTEGDGSQQSQRSIVYLHAATVGDIPDPSSVKYGQKAASKEELSDSSRIQPQSKTLSRSFSVLAPWRPRYIRENRYINYYQPPSSTEKPSRKENNKPKNQKSLDTLQKKKTFTLSRSKENLIRKQKDETPKSATLYKKREHASRENSRYVKDDTKISAKSQSFESLRRDDHNNTLNRRGDKNKKGDISRSVSMPKDPERLAGWYKNNKKSEYKPRV